MAFLYMLLFFCLIDRFLICLVPSPSHCADPDPLQDFCPADLNSTIYVNGFPCKNPARVTQEDFFFTGFNRINGTDFNIYGLNITEGDVYTFPGLNTLGISQNRARILPGGINNPHVHPRAMELARIDEGTVLVGIITSERVFYSRVCRAGEMFVVPKGLLHFQLNIGKVIATLFASFNSQNPGTERVVEQLFNSNPPVPSNVLTAAFRANNETIEAIRANNTQMDRQKYLS